jgi:hypothetical protein
VVFPAPEGDDKIKSSPLRIIAYSTFWTCSRI